MATDSAALPPLNSSALADNSATDLSARQVCRFASIALCLYPLVLADPIRSSAAVVPAWWTVTAVSVLVLTSTAMLVASWFADAWWLHQAALTVALTYVAAFLSFPFAWSGDTTAGGTGVWLAPIAGVVSLAAAVAMPITVATAYLVGAVTSTRLISSVVTGRTGAEQFATELAWGLSVAAVPFIIGIVALRAGRVLDFTRERAKRRAVEAAASQSRQRERIRFDAITHDRVLSIMLAASRSGTSIELQDQASATLAQLDALKAEDDLHRNLPPDEVRRQFASATGLVDASISIRGDASDAEYSLEVVHAMSSAMMEAIQNSVRHAGPDAACFVDVQISADTLVAEITDDGNGFDSSAVPVDRLGIALSIRARMNNVAGGAASITSEPGNGTRVTLSWRRSR